MGKNYLKEAQSKYGKELRLYTNMVAEFQNRGLTYKTLSSAVEGIIGYLKECEENEEPVAITGIVLASGLTKDAYGRVKNGEYDHIIARTITQYNVEVGEDGYGEVEGERVYLNPAFPYSAIIERAEMIHEYETEKRLADNSRKNVVADIFSLKARHGWQEEDTRNTNNLTINVASVEEAKKSLKALKGE